MQYLFQGLVVDETGSVLGDLKLALLYLFAELPVLKEQGEQELQMWQQIVTLRYAEGCLHVAASDPGVRQKAAGKYPARRKRKSQSDSV